MKGRMIHVSIKTGLDKNGTKANMFIYLVVFLKS